MNSLVDPPFAKDPPVKVNVNAKTLGLVLLILGAIGILLDALALIGILGFCGTYSIYGGCNLPILWLLGDLIGLAAVIIGTIGAYRMYQLDPEGKQWVVYGLILGIVGAVVTLIGNYAAYSGLIGIGAGGGVIFGLIIDLIIYGVLYYLVVVSRFPGQAPLSPPAATSWSGGGPCGTPSSAHRVGEPRADSARVPRSAAGPGAEARGLAAQAGGGAVCGTPGEIGAAGQVVGAADLTARVQHLELGQPPGWAAAASGPGARGRGQDLADTQTAARMSSTRR